MLKCFDYRMLKCIDIHMFNTIHMYTRLDDEMSIGSKANVIV